MEYVRLGQVSKTFGLEGQVRVFSLTDFAAKRFKIGAKVSLFNEKTNERSELTLKSFRDSGDSYFLGFEEIPNIDAAEKIIGDYVEIDKALAPLPKGFYRLEDLKGCAILDENKKVLGKVSQILSYAPTKTLVVSRDGAKPFYVPFVMDEFILTIDIAKKEITIKVMPGLL
jgi:16S rRNA processing protein RimM